VRVLLVGEDDLSHGSLLHRLAAGLAARPGVEARVEIVRRPRGVEALMIRNVRPLGQLDLQPLRWRLRYSARARQSLRRHAGRVDAVIVNTQSCALLSTGPMRRVPTLLSVDITGRQFAQMDFWGRHTRPSALSERPIEALERRAYRSAAKVLAWSEWTAVSLREDYGVEPERLELLHFGVELPDATPPREAGGAPLQLLFVGNFTHRKGLDTLLEALPLAGDGIELHVVTNDALPPRPGVHVHSGLEPGGHGMRERLRLADAFVLPTRADAVPWAVVEAMAAGLPVVATRVGAIPELVGDAGLLVDVGDARALAGVLRRLRDEPGLRDDLGGRARRRAEARYDEAVQLPRLAEIVRACA
jgi:glycosyltransferase involved in cell wall biosynthesis